MDTNQNECMYIMDSKKWGILLEVRSFFQKFADYYYDNSISEVTTPPDTVNAEFTVDMVMVDFSGAFMEGLQKVLKKIDSFGLCQSDHETVLIKICIENVWTVVDTCE